MTVERLTYEEMEAKLDEAQDILRALRHHEVDAIVGDRDIAVVRLQEVEETLHKAKAQLEERVLERTAELAKVNRQLQEALERQQRIIEADKEHLGSLTEELMMTEERQRRQIAQALHDSVGQSLAFAKRELRLLRQRGPEEVRGTLDEVCRQLEDAIRQTRDLTFELSPSTLYTLGLQAALEELAEQFAESEGFHCRVEGPGDCLPLNEQVRSLLYRSVRELLVNVAKHAEARNVRIVLDRDEQGFRISVQDDGKGFDVSVLQGRGRGGGFGMLSVRERLVRVGGAFAVESVQGKGTTVTMIVPGNCGQRSDRGFDGIPT